LFCLKGCRDIGFGHDSHPPKNARLVSRRDRFWWHAQVIFSNARKDTLIAAIQQRARSLMTIAA
jgi:hypothetical protein